MSESAKPSFEFGPFSLDPGKRLLLRNGAAVPLAPKVLETLLALVENRDRVLSKDELLDQVWGGASVEEGGLTRNVSILRKTLGEKPDDHRFIVTVPGCGYRFVAAVNDPTVNERLPVAVQSSPVLQNGRASGARTRRWLAVAGLAVVALGSTVYMLRPAATSVRSPITSLAVLPLNNLSGDPKQDYFADGMTEALIGNLAPISALRVVSRTSVMRFKGTKTSLPEIARELKVDAVIEGSVQRTRDRVRISVQLIHAPSDTHLWAREYERELTDVLKLQGDVARAVADEIRVQVTAEERARMASAGTVDPIAHQEFLLGRHHLWKLTEEDLSRAIEHFERATRLDAGYAAAYAGLSHAWWWRGVWGSKTFKETESPSRAAARKAVALDPRLAEAHVSMGRVKFGHDWDWTGAENDFGRALDIDPNNLDAHFFSAMLFMALGRFSESIAHIERAAQLDPLSSTVHSAFGRVLYRARKFDQAIPHLKQAIALEPGPRSSDGYGRLADVYEELGRHDEALALYEKVNVLGGRPARSPDVAIVFARMGKRDEANRAVAAARNTSPPAQLAQAYAVLGNNDEAFRLLFKHAEEHNSLNYVKTEPRFDSLRADPRWPLLLRRMNLPVDIERDTTVK
jgi:TolB-like protein/DNA-binding winged helix-turn-helix (wHTH) protein/tetratricopeptide (TPR) repeat protein